MSNQQFENQKEKDTRIKRLAEELTQQLIDEKLMKDYGTSMIEGMNHDYVATIKEKYYLLEQQFNQIDVNKDQTLSYSEFFNFFSTHKNKTEDVVIDNNYIERLFYLLDKDKSDSISLEEFIFAYIGFEQKLKLKQTRLNLLRKDLQHNVVKYEEKFKQTENERLNKEGLCENANLSITLFEATNLKGKSTIQTRNTYVVFSLGGGKKQMSSVKEEDNPSWFEDFNFPVSKKNEELLIDVYDKGALTGNNLIGSVRIQLLLFDHQLKTENWYPLTLGSTPDDFGSIHLKFRFIYSYHKYYQGLIEKTKDQIMRLEEDLGEMKEYKQLFDEPFGIILGGKINSIIEKRIFEKSEEILDYIGSTRKSIYIPPKQAKDQIQMTRKSILFSGPDSVEWPAFASILLGLSCLFSLLAFLTKADYLNLLILVGVFIVIMTDAKYGITTYLKSLSYGLIGISVYDLIWMMFNYGSWNNGVYYNSNTLLGTFIFVALNCGAKCGLAYYCYSQDLKIITIKKRGQEEILNKNIKY